MMEAVSVGSELDSLSHVTSSHQSPNKPQSGHFGGSEVTQEKNLNKQIAKHKERVTQMEEEAAGKPGIEGAGLRMSIILTQAEIDRLQQSLSTQEQEIKVSDEHLPNPSYSRENPPSNHQDYSDQTTDLLVDPRIILSPVKGARTERPPETTPEEIKGTDSEEIKETDLAGHTPPYVDSSGAVLRPSTPTTREFSREEGDMEVEELTNSAIKRARNHVDRVTRGEPLGAASGEALLSEFDAGISVVNKTRVITQLKDKLHSRLQNIEQSLQKDSRNVLLLNERDIAQHAYNEAADALKRLAEIIS